MIRLREIRPQPHPASVIFKRYKIPIASVAIALDLSYSHVSSILTGIRKPTHAVDLRLKELAEQLEREVCDVGK